MSFGAAGIWIVEDEEAEMLSLGDVGIDYIVCLPRVYDPACNYYSLNDQSVASTRLYGIILSRDIQDIISMTSI